MAKKPPPENRSRRRMLFALGVVAAVVVYGLAVERTGVSLDEITSEPRQESLVRIIRSLARPELVTYDFDIVETDVEVQIPCSGSDDPAEGPQLVVTPGCAEPESIVTLRGFGFEPLSSGSLQFIPDSEFDVTLTLGRYEADENGEFEQELKLPQRPSENPQIIRALIPERLGTWGDRQEVWTDTNENGVVDAGIIEAGGLTISVPNASSDFPAVALLDATRQVVDFVTTGEPFVAVDGPAIGGTAEPIGEEREAVSISQIDTESGLSLTVSGPTGTDVSAWRVAIYDGVTGEVVATEFLGDQIELSPRISQTSMLTLDKIIDTVFLALVATTAGLIVALPLSFIAARNLMKDVSTTVLGLGLGLIAIPLGVWGGMQYVELQRDLLGGAISNPAGLFSLLLVGGAVAYFLIRRVLFGPEITSTAFRAGLGLGMVVSLSAFLEGFFGLLTAGGEALHDAFGPLGFVPRLFSTLGEVGTVALPLIVGLGAISVTVGLSTRIAYWLKANLPTSTRYFLGYLTMAVAGAVVAALFGALVNWLYQTNDLTKTLVVPAVVGALIGLVIADRGRQRGEIKTGLTIYYVARTIFNTLRSIEPLVMVIVFVVWVGFGEFAGSIALALHTAAALAKLYSEQVESIAEGPLEAVRATGATRLQSTIYAVVPQIVPPYIAFTMYRWDINVRMSTILGFAGGGGIGFLLQQNVQLGQYRAAAVQMLAITIVVATMDYASSRLRRRFT